jgi:hypothetical protein
MGGCLFHSRLSEWFAKNNVYSTNFELRNWIEEFEEWAFSPIS